MMVGGDGISLNATTTRKALNEVLSVSVGHTCAVEEDSFLLELASSLAAGATIARQSLDLTGPSIPRLIGF
jgi:hypothetical protein